MCEFAWSECTWRPTFEIPHVLITTVKDWECHEFMRALWWVSLTSKKCLESAERGRELFGPKALHMRVEYNIATKVRLLCVCATFKGGAALS